MVKYKPVKLTEKEAQALLKKQPSVVVVDAFSRQLKELAKIKRKRITSEYKYFFYPWNNVLVKCVEHKNYFLLKTNRNQDLITAVEQKKLYDCKVAVFGMSVGSNIAFVLTQAGISRQIIIADFDELDTTNMNRIMAGVHQIGLNKTVIAARRIYEDNPYAKVKIMPTGISEKNLEPPLRSGKIDLMVEEIDNIVMKIKIRKLAFKYKVPVLMITDNGDGVVLHIERYDLGYNKIFQKSITYWDKKLLGQIDKKMTGDVIMNDIVGGADKVDSKMLKSVQKVFNKELVSWSQLGSAALLGGVVSTIAVKKIVLGEHREPFTRRHVNIML